VAGYKIGCVSEIVRRQLGLTHPVFGHVFTGELHAGGCTLDHTRYAGLAIEGEFAVHIDRDIDGAEWFERDPRPPISAVFPVIELHNYIFRGSGPAAPELIANNAIHAGVVLSPEEPLPSTLENLREPISVWINGELKGVSDGSAVAGSIAAGLLTLVERLEPFGIHLRKGQLALTGSPLPLYRVGAGDRIEVRCEGLPTVSAVIV
jgi:2-keto-4-pentenoate hydratase